MAIIQVKIHKREAGQGTRAFLQGSVTRFRAEKDKARASIIQVKIRKREAFASIFTTSFNENGDLRYAKRVATEVADKILILSRLVIIKAKWRPLCCRELGFLAFLRFYRLLQSLQWTPSNSQHYTIILAIMQAVLSRYGSEMTFLLFSIYK